MSVKLKYGAENFLPEGEIEYFDVELSELPEGVDVDVMYNSFSVASDGRLYMGTCRTLGSGHILRYDPACGKVEDVANLDEAIGDFRNGHDRQGKIHGGFFEHGDGYLYGATHMDIATPVYGNYYDEHRYAGGHWFRLDQRTGRLEDLGISRPGEGILTYTMDRVRGVLYGVTWPSGYLYSFDIKTCVSRNLGRTGIHLSRFIHSMSDGTVFCSMKDGFIGRYRPGYDCIESTSCRIPLRIGERDWSWRRGVMQCAAEQEPNKSFVAFAGNPALVSLDSDGGCYMRSFPLFKEGIYSCFELAVSDDKCVYYSHCEWGGSPSLSGRLFRFDPSSGENEIVGYMRCGGLCDFRHISGGAMSPDKRTLYYHALVPKDMENRFDLTHAKLAEENDLFARGLVDEIWMRKYFKPVLVICKI